MTHLRIGRLAAPALIAALAALCVAACGSSSNTSSSSAAAAANSSGSTSSSGAASSAANRTKLTACLKAHGVTLPARPAGARRPPKGGAGGTGRTGGFFFGGGAGNGGGRLANNPKLRAAFQACGGGRGFGGQRRFTISHSLINKFATCVKQHGYTLPKPNFSGKGPVFPASIEKNKKFQAAAKSCTTILRPAGAPGGGSPPGGGTSTTGA